MIDTLRSVYWRLVLRLRGVRVGRNFRAEGPLRMLLRDGASFNNIRIGHNVTFGGKTYIRLRKNGRITIGDDVSTGTDVWLVCANDFELVVGDRTRIGSYSILNGGHGIAIGNDCLLAAFVYMTSSNHKYDRGRLIREQGFSGEPIVVGDDVWLGGHVHVHTGVRIGSGSVVGSGAVVTKDIDNYKVAVGNPAQCIRERV